MRSPFAEWLDQMQRIADTENVIVQARHIDVLEYSFKSGETPMNAYKTYRGFLKRWNSLTDNGRNTEAT